MEIGQNMNTDKNDYATGQQPAFLYTSKLMCRLIQGDGFAPIEVGIGVMLAALATMRTAHSRTELAELLYRYADEYAVRAGDM